MIITIFQGDALIAVETVTGLPSLNGYTAKLYIYDDAGTSIDTLTGGISGLDINWEAFNDDTKTYPVGIHIFESKIFNSGDLVFTLKKGIFEVKETIEEDPA